MLVAAWIASIVLAAPPEAPSEAKVRESVGLAVAYLQEESASWVRDRKCASCHHANMTLWAVAEAKARGFAVDDKAQEALAKAVLEDPSASKIVLTPPPPGAKLGPGDLACLPTVYGLLAANAVGGDAYTASGEKLRAVILAKQRPDGGWEHGGGRPPMLESREIATLMGLLALEGSDDPTVAASREKANAWLKAEPTPGSLQGRVLRLLVAARSGTPPESLAPEVEAILKLQRPEGGWSQTPETPADAWATGQTLYALMRAGLKPDRPEVARARAFLVAAQTEDGSWPMTSRPGTPGDGKPANDLTPITAASVAWATLGLVSSGAK